MNVGKEFFSPIRRLFLADGLGALLTAFCLAIILARFETFFGMPKHILYPLALAACFFAAYSLSCYYFAPTNWKPYLKALGIANLLYSIVTFILVLLYFEKLTVFGKGYFLIEILVILALAIFEWRTAHRN